MQTAPNEPGFMKAPNQHPCQFVLNGIKNINYFQYEIFVRVKNYFFLQFEYFDIK